MMEKIIQAALDYVQAYFAGDSSGHDADHTLRVWRMARRIAEAEGGDQLTVQLAALLHDVDDRKLSPQTCAGKDHAVQFLQSQGVTDDFISRVVEIIGDISFSGGRVPASLEGQIVQDADRLDAIGAIGIARTFAYGGAKGRRLHDPSVAPEKGQSRAAYAAGESTGINHFYEKLLLLKDLMNTSEGKRLAVERHRYMEGFLQELFSEWDGLK